MIEDIHEHAREVACAAGLPVMGEVLSILVDREEISEDRLRELDGDDITELYEDILGPAVDDISDAIQDLSRWSVNGHLDHYIGYVDGGVADEIEKQFGSFPQFGYAGGCVNMVFDIDGHRVNVTDADTSLLTPLKQHTAEHGYSVGVYTPEGFETGQSKIVLTKHVGVDGLYDLIRDALSTLNIAQSL